MNHNFSLSAIKPQKIRKGGTRTDASAALCPFLKGMALSILNLDPKGIREPHWHPNANELSYCTEGTGKMTIFAPGHGHDTFAINPGDIVFVPMGYLHHIENTGNTALNLVICFDNENPEDLDISSGVAVMPEHILADTFSLDSSFFDKLNKDINGVFISEQAEIPTESVPATGRYKMALDAIIPQVNTKGGTVKMSNDFLLPTLEGLAAYGVVLTPKGAREPHWHPNAAEINYLIKGEAQITLLSPKGVHETFNMKAGDFSYMPRGYLHHIENIGTEDAKFIVFFNNPSPSDIGFSGSFGAYSNEVLASLFGVPVEYFQKLPKYQEDLLVVGGG